MATYSLMMTSQKGFQMENKMTAVVCRPGESAVIEEIGCGLEDLQHFVDGYIECVYPFDDDVVLIVNEEGKINGLPFNRALRGEDGEIYDVIAGAFLILGITEDNFQSLSPELAEKYRKHFEFPEIFLSIDGRIVAFKIIDDRKE